MEFPEEIKILIFSHFDLVTLIIKKKVSRSWNSLCTTAINEKCSPETRTAFVTNAELREAVRRYCGYRLIIPEVGGMPIVYMNEDRAPDREEAERIARLHGWPINRWDVSTISDFSRVFEYLQFFNEDISSWDVSNAIRMDLMFFCARQFNMDIAGWDVSNVTNMYMMFAEASSFNQDLRRWDVGRVNIMIDMFADSLISHQIIATEWDRWNAVLLSRVWMHELTEE